MASCHKQLIKEFLEVHDILEEQINKKSEVYEKLKIEVLEKTNEISTLTENLQQMIVSINTQKEIIQKLKEETAKYEVHTGEVFNTGILLLSYQNTDVLISEGLCQKIEGTSTTSK
uniref:Prefoldin subunit 6 n=1 Tax=Caenorhabditis tropicalis TaxID=1561998 RepID=A0A1I7U138_9PELO